MAKILLVDDSPADIRFMTEVLRGMGHTVASTSDPATVEQVIGSEKPELVLLDVVMPDRNGYEVLRGIKREFPNPDFKVIFVSSKGSETDIKWGLRQGAADYIIKPYTPADVQGVLSRHL
ncbi:response regulator receiver protein (plasmid) [Deinococcus proteolyticus MRP]|uniref:Response regulator receiver protein n=1 Tax=Deinococcus proteolyticus (strain ATCC 35074 / DSM 20540 / JCM 6276 / NBRC 101906 / NCIMB 13154 / VKM Ac-1939 / CCM 2703 / MRP) TaxID=693977 RepID=F0RPT3_DEIPM|nr:MULTISPECIES: response regulator [Deinococcus]ADY27389.1 response regulator receiver protein [Deinococcus proteolyticus MRP]MCY1704264.1 response regulator [Deinococcus sp. SL84]